MKFIYTGRNEDTYINLDNISNIKLNKGVTKTSFNIEFYTSVGQKIVWAFTKEEEFNRIAENINNIINEDYFIGARDED